MITRYNVDNNVRATLASSITSIDTSVTINKASPPYRDPPAPADDSSDSASIITLLDSLSDPTKIEAVTYTGLVDNGDGTITLSGLTRGHEGTIASAYSAGHYAVQCLTAGVLSSPLLQLDHANGRVNLPGGSNQNLPAAHVYGDGIRVFYPGGVQNVIECADDSHAYNQRIFSITCLGTDFGINYPPPATPSGRSFVFRMTYSNYPMESRPVVVMKNIEVERLEMHRVTRWWPEVEGSLASNTTIDWAENDILRMSLSSNAVVTFLDTSDYMVLGGSYRRLTLLVTIANVANPGYTVTFPSDVKIPAGVSAPTFNTGQNQIRVLEFLYDGTYWLYEGMRTYQL